MSSRWKNLILCILLSSEEAMAQQQTAQSKQPLRILHVMSYHSPWRWTDGQLDGFKSGLGENLAEYKVFQLDTKRKSDAVQKNQSGKKARGLVGTWRPDLIYTSDDDAQDLVTKYFLNSKIPQVFSGVNESPEYYGFDKSSNVTGVVEHEHFTESVRLLKGLVPKMKRLVVVLDDAEMWGPVVLRMKAARLPPDVSIVGWETIKTFAQYKERVSAYPEIADGIALIGIFNFKDQSGKNVPYQEVLRWTAENSRLPDLSFWMDRVNYGTLAAVTVSEREQGVSAGRLARKILIEHQAPNSLPIVPTTKGLPAISLARAKKLGIGIESSQLLSAEVVTKFQWDMQ